MEILIKETRGRKSKYSFNDMEVGERRVYTGTKVATILGCVKKWSERRGLTWKFRSYTENNCVHLVRVE